MRVLIFGDSITQGMWDRQGGWVQRLISDYFIRQIDNLEADMPIIFNLGISADTTVELLARFEHEVKARLRPELAFIIAIGTNDSRVDGRTSFSTPEQYAANLKSLITKAEQFVDKSQILFVGLQPCDETRTTPVSWRDVSYTNQRLQVFDQTLRQVCSKQGVLYAPIFEEFQQKQQSSEDLLIDGLHPNDAGHQLIYGQVKPKLATMIAA